MSGFHYIGLKITILLLIILSDLPEHLVRGAAVQLCRLVHILRSQSDRGAGRHAHDRRKLRFPNKEHFKLTLQFCYISFVSFFLVAY